jgi:DNA-binding beta-propeller fold protein YncE
MDLSRFAVAPVLLAVALALPGGTATTVTATIAVGNSPFGVAVNAAAGPVYVANGGDGTLSVINGWTTPCQ